MAKKSIGQAPAGMMEEETNVGNKRIKFPDRIHRIKRLIKKNIFVLAPSLMPSGLLFEQLNGTGGSQAKRLSLRHSLF